MKVLGIDEAGRGPVLGSMFIAGVIVKKEDEKKLREIGVKDSKQLEDEEREELALKIQDIAENAIIIELTAQEIDRLMPFINLNEIELQNFAKIIEEANLTKDDLVILDLPEKNGENFIFRIKKFLSEEKRNIKIIAENKADENYPVVSAASIMAKSNREKHMAKLSKKYKFYLKTGYPHDENTINFLENYIQKNKKLPEEARKSWETSKRLVDKYIQKKLGEF